ncbi:hypothetical protein BDQ12DRAFT_738665 [Crucibulum laeve]|uniref:Protein kinase domain-containing protein n=1 Tax=Crucibulum laeve TaxID=68775 RepID=A0A5C3LLQ1_9AGAR|nr:hypothetical protein BDQ12DRAFT_738665 [Crucibulum laeve]
MSYDNQVDIWMLGCAAYHLLTGEALFSPVTAEGDSNHLAQMRALTGDRIKTPIALKSKRREEFFTDTGAFKGSIQDTSLYARLTASGNFAKANMQQRLLFSNAK